MKQTVSQMESCIKSAIGRAWLPVELECIGGERLSADGWSESPEVSVVMPVHNGEAHVSRSIASILNQTWGDFEFIIIDDASQDKTIEVLQEAAAADRRIRVLKLRENQGPYVCKNLGLCHARGRIVALQDADDVSALERLSMQIEALREHPSALVCTVQYQRLDETGTPVLNRGKLNRRCYAALAMVRREVITRVGYFDSVRAAADDEFWRRLRLLLPSRGFRDIERPLYFAYVRGDSLSAGDVALDVKSGSGSDFLSEERRAYVEGYQGWHKKSESPLMGFPVRRRPFSVPDGLAPSDWYGNLQISSVVASIASVPERKEGLRCVVRRVLPQVDYLYVYLNNYGAIPEFLDHPRIHVACSEDHGDLVDNGKFFFVSQFVESAAYHFTLDDDIEYPPNYVSYMLAKLCQYADSVVVGMHGSVFRNEFSDYYDTASRKVFNYERELLPDQQVHVLGTGTTAYPTALIKPELNYFKSTGMADLYFAGLAKELSVPLLSVARGSGYLRSMETVGTESLYESCRGEGNPQSEFIKSRWPWRFPDLDKKE